MNLFCEEPNAAEQPCSRANVALTLNLVFRVGCLGASRTLNPNVALTLIIDVWEAVSWGNMKVAQLERTLLVLWPDASVDIHWVAPVRFSNVALFNEYIWRMYSERHMKGGVHILDNRSGLAGAEHCLRLRRCRHPPGCCWVQGLDEHITWHLFFALHLHHLFSQVTWWRASLLNCLSWWIDCTSEI